MPPASRGSLTISLRCECGQTYHADPAHAGRAVRCRCGRTLTVPARQSSPVLERPARQPTSKDSVRPAGTKWPHLKWPRLRATPRVLRSLTLLSWGYLAGTLIAITALWLLAERWWPATVFLFGPRWPLLLPVLPLALSALALKPRLLAPVSLATLLTLAPVMGYTTGWRRLFSSTAPRELRLITFNVGGGRNSRIGAIPLELTRYDPDILAFQECPPGLADPSRWPPGWTTRAEGSLCVVSRFHITRTTTEDRTETGMQGGTGTVVLFQLATPAGAVDLAVVHLETPRKGLERLRYGGDAGSVTLNSLVRDVGSERSSRWIAARSPEAIIAGDFNLPVESRIFRDHWSRCPDAFTTAGHGFGYTRVLPSFSIRIDHILACGSWRAIHAELGPDLGSDHLPLIVDLARRR